MPATAGSEAAHIRKWAQQHGYTVSSRGRLSEEIVVAYRQANPAGSAGKRRSAAQKPSRPAPGGAGTPRRAEARAGGAAKRARAASPAAPSALVTGADERVGGRLEEELQRVTAELSELRRRLVGVERQLADLPSAEEQARRVAEHLTERAGEQLAGTVEKVRTLFRR